MVNDGGGEAVTAPVKQKYPSVTIVELAENGGSGCARNAGAEAATGELLAFLDSDDLWLPEKLSRQVEFLRSHPDSDCLHCGLITFDEAGDIAEHTDKPSLLGEQDILFRGHVLPSSMLIKKDVFTSIGGFSPVLRIGEDYDLVIRLVKASNTIRFQPEALVRFRRMNQGNLSMDWVGILNSKRAVYHLHRDFFNAVGGRGHQLAFFSSLYNECASKARIFWRIPLKGISSILGLLAKLF